MEAVQALSALAFLLVMTILGLRLLMLAWQNGQAAELLLGLSFLLGGSLGATVEAVAMAGAEQIPNAGLLLGMGKFFGMVGMLASCLFTWWVFRRDDARGVVAIAFIMLVIVTAFAGHAASGAFETGEIARQWFLLELAGRVATPGWLGLEAYWYWRAMQRRAALGLAEPVVVNRFGLWVVASVSGVVCLSSSVPPLFLEAGHPLLDADMLLFAAAGIATVVAYWLAFFPPARYRAWVESRAVAATSA